MSMSWRSDLLTSGRRQQKAIDAAIDWTACVHADAQHFEHLLWASHKTRKESWTNKVKITWFILKQMKKMFRYCWRCDFKVPKVSQGKVCTLNRWCGIINHVWMACSLGNICTKYYWNRTTTVKIIIGGSVVSFLWDSVDAEFLLKSNLKSYVLYRM